MGSVDLVELDLGLDMPDVGLAIPDLGLLLLPLNLASSSSNASCALFLSISASALPSGVSHTSSKVHGICLLPHTLSTSNPLSSNPAKLVLCKSQSFLRTPGPILPPGTPSFGALL